MGRSFCFLAGNGKIKHSFCCVPGSGGSRVQPGRDLLSLEETAVQPRDLAFIRVMREHFPLFLRAGISARGVIYLSCACVTLRYILLH